jgi:hypothetical protein
MGEELALAAPLALPTELPLVVEDTLTPPVELATEEELVEAVELGLVDSE